MGFVWSCDGFELIVIELKFATTIRDSMVAEWFADQCRLAGVVRQIRGGWRRLNYSGQATKGTWGMSRR